MPELEENARTRSSKTLHVGLLERLLARASLTLLPLMLTTATGLFSRHHWIADLCANLRNQQVIALIGLFVIVLLSRRWYWLGLSILLIAIHLPWYASAFFGATAAGQPAELTVMVVNVLTSNRNFQLVEEEVAKASPDALAVLELGTPLASSLDETLASAYPHRIAIPQDGGNFGIGLYSRHPLSHVERLTFNVPSIETIAVTISKNKSEYRMVATHPLPPIGAGGFADRNEHLRQLADHIARFRSQDTGTPIIVLGDFNLTPWSPLFTDLEAATKLKRAGRGYGLTPTWYAKFETFAMGLMLDHCLISDELQCVSHRVGGDIGSDHRAVIVGLKRRN